MKQRLSTHARATAWILGLCLSFAVTMVTATSSMAAVPSAQSCTDLASARIANTTITAAQNEPAGTYVDSSGTHSNMPAFCRVTATIAPAIDIEVWLPTSTWNGRYLANGSGGLGGYIYTSVMDQYVQEGFASSVTDTGHTGSDIGSLGCCSWIANLTLLRNWGHDSIHQTAVVTKALIALYYGRPARWSYYIGGSTGGGEGVEEAEFYPTDFNGIVARTPGNGYSHLIASFIWAGLPVAENPANALSAQQESVLQSAVIASCGQHDGSIPGDGYLNDPRQCNFDPKTIECSARLAPPNCLPPAQVATAEHIYSPTRDPVTGQEIYPGYDRGDETGWGTLDSTLGIENGSLAQDFSQPLIGYGVLDDPLWNWTTFNFHTDMQLVEKYLSPNIDASTGNLTAFERDGGKLLMTQGWDDPIAAEFWPIEYYNKAMEVTADKSLSKLQSFFRLFMIPGGGHAGGGIGPDIVNPVGVAMNWVEHGQAPQGVFASVTNTSATGASTTITRPLCMYPTIMHYKGHGSTSDSTSFDCVNDEKDFLLDTRGRYNAGPPFTPRP